MSGDSHHLIITYSRSFCSTYSIYDAVAHHRKHSLLVTASIADVLACEFHDFCTLCLTIRPWIWHLRLTDAYLLSVGLQNYTMEGSDNPALFNCLSASTPTEFQVESIDCTSSICITAHGRLLGQHILRRLNRHRFGTPYFDPKYRAFSGCWKCFRQRMICQSPTQDLLMIQNRGFS